MKRVRLAIVALLLFVAGAALAQPSKSYIYPLPGTTEGYSASYGEMRPNHFHSGVDMRTDRVEGRAVVAVADGYISRIAISSAGYGLALYVTHPDKGTVSVYGHLSRLRSDIAEYLAQARYAERQHSKSIFPKSDIFPVRQGDTIALSGNSGSSFGPHLHFEIRDAKSGHTLNPVKVGAVTPHDTIAPRILRLHYVAIDTLLGGAKSRLAGSYTAQFDGECYRLASEVKVFGKGYFVVEARDSRNNSTNRFGIYGARLKIDNRLHFDYRIDRFAFADTRHCNIVSFYPIQRTAKCEALRMAKMPLAPDYLYGTMCNDGIVSFAQGERGGGLVEVEDECGNIATLRFSICGIAPQPATEVTEAIEADMVALDSYQECRLTGEGFSLFLPRGALYEAEQCRTKAVEDCVIKDTTIVQISPIYRIFAEDTPLNKAYKVRIAVDAPLALQRHLCVAHIGERGRMRALGGEFRSDSVELVTRRGGAMVVVADTIAPQIRPRFSNGADMRGVAEMSFVVKDNFSGIAEYRLLIDGEWRTLDLQPIKGELKHRFDAPLEGRGKVRSVELEVRDRCGNVATWRGTILK